MKFYISNPGARVESSSEQHGLSIDLVLAKPAHVLGETRTKLVFRLNWHSSAIEAQGLVPAPLFALTRCASEKGAQVSCESCILWLASIAS